MNPIELGKFIANLRNEKDITQEELAEKLFIDKRKVSRWECGTSIPEFEMLIKLSEILDVSLYELSICKRITNDKLNRRIINKFKSIKDFRKFKIRKLIQIAIFILLLVFFLIMTGYTFKYNNTVEIYDLHSLDENYFIEGKIIKINNDYNINIINITDNYTSTKESLNHYECNYELFSDTTRIFSTNDNSQKQVSNKDNGNIIFKPPLKITQYIYNNSVITFKSDCKNSLNYSFKFELIKKYDNKLF